MLCFIDNTQNLERLYCLKYFVFFAYYLSSNNKLSQKEGFWVVLKNFEIIQKHEKFPNIRTRIN